MSLPDRKLVDLFSDLKSAEEVTSLFETDAGKQWLLTPLSKEVADSGLSYMVDGYFGGSGRKTHKEFTAAALAALEKFVPDAEERVALLCAVNERGQSVIHKSLAYGGHVEAYEPVLEALYKWAGEEKADAIMKGILAEPLGRFDKDISYMFQSLRAMRPMGSAEYQRIDALTTDSYHPVTAAGLRETLKELRPIVAEWIDSERKKTDLSDYAKGQLEKMQSFYDSADPVTEKGTLLTEYFPGKAFYTLLEIQMKGDSTTPAQKADALFAILATKDADGNTPMHREWVVSDLLGTPTDPRSFVDKFSPMLAKFDQMLGTDISIKLAVRLLLQENAQGELPLDKMQYPKPPVRDYALEKMLHTLRSELGSKEKFETYVKEVIAPVLPADFKIKLQSYEPTPAEGAKPSRGAKWEP